MEIKDGDRSLNNQNIEDEDENSRLRWLSVHCLVKHFQYLNSVDLYKLSEINKMYKQIHDFVIPKHEFNFDELSEKGSNSFVASSS